MPGLTDLPEDLQPLVSLNALRITGDTFRGDLERLVDAIKPILEKAAAKEQERLATEHRQREEAEARQRVEKERLETRTVDEVGSEQNRVSEDRKMPEGKLRLTVHSAYFAATGTQCFFVNATNISLQWDLEITHVWFATNPEVYVTNPDRPLPRRLKPQESWETWVRTTAIPRAALEQTYTLARARLSTGEIIESIENIGVPKYGTVPGGDYRPI
jgi:hypothetical protein